MISKCDLVHQHSWTPFQQCRVEHSQKSAIAANFRPWISIKSRSVLSDSPFPVGHISPVKLHNLLNVSRNGQCDTEICNNKKELTSRLGPKNSKTDRIQRNKKKSIIRLAEISQYCAQCKPNFSSFICPVASVGMLQLPRIFCPFIHLVFKFFFWFFFRVHCGLTVGFRRFLCRNRHTSPMIIN